jgi:hypothetical protein
MSQSDPKTDEDDALSTPADADPAADDDDDGDGDDYGNKGGPND